MCPQSTDQIHSNNDPLLPTTTRNISRPSNSTQENTHRAAIRVFIGLLACVTLWAGFIKTASQNPVLGGALMGLAFAIPIALITNRPITKQVVLQGIVGVLSTAAFCSLGCELVEHANGDWAKLLAGAVDLTMGPSLGVGMIRFDQFIACFIKYFKELEDRERLLTNSN